ncbi:hypothetical protein GOP47_0020964 [Adiantum capillus-veneris]|uniref:Uncharacterized protein n=1 Tax=Adiantum capillus-veneris TaxID=13818 RepID=A0A9D4UA63_ADICA|nr:hypothetical protein GOP47_0020964 [Adiantum capillus-veneris]
MQARGRKRRKYPLTGRIKSYGNELLSDPACGLWRRVGDEAEAQSSPSLSRAYRQGYEKLGMHSHATCQRLTARESGLR